MSVEWQPIATAPSHTWVLVRCPSGMNTTPYRISVAKHDPNYRPRNPWITETNDAVDDGGEQPTEWTPLEPFIKPLHPDYVTVTHGGAGYFAVFCRYYHDMQGYDAWNTGHGRYATFAEAPRHQRPLHVHWCRRANGSRRIRGTSSPPLSTRLPSSSVTASSTRCCTGSTPTLSADVGTAYARPQSKMARCTASVIRTTAAGGQHEDQRGRGAWHRGCVRRAGRGGGQLDHAPCGAAHTRKLSYGL